jgi:Gas vesicle synthesis protein GvpL/GvpF
MARIGFFLYGLIRATGETTFGNLGLEHDGKRGEVKVLPTGHVAAVVSELPTRNEVLPTRRNLEAFNTVIKEVMSKHTVVPISFGHLVKGPNELSRLLKANQDDILEELDRLENKVEMTLRVRWDVENIFDYFLRYDPDLAAARDETFKRTAQPSQQQKMELGQMFEERLTEERRRHTDHVLEVFRECTAEVKVNPPGSEKMVMNLALLVDRPELPRFERKVHEVAEQFPGQFAFDYNGPWAPFNFVEVALSPGGGA